MTSLNKLPLIPLCFLVLMSPFVRGDWVNLSGAENAPTIAEIYINEDYVQLTLEIYIDDLLEFDQLLPDEFFKDNGIDIARTGLSERMRIFSEETFQFVTDDGEKLRAELKLLEKRFRKKRPSPLAGGINPFTGQRIPGPPEDKRVFYAEVMYSFKDKPKSLTIIPPLGENGSPSVAIGFAAFHKGSPVVGFKYLPGATKLNLDWQDCWYTAFENKALSRFMQSGVQSFIYVEPYEVRHEILVRVKDLAGWMDLELRSDDFIEIDEFDILKKRAGQFFLDHDKVLIDGKVLRPILDRVSFVKYSMTRSQFIDVPERLPLTTAMVGVIVTYLTDGIANEVAVEWDLFSERIQNVPAIAIDPAGPFLSYITPDDNLHVWQNYLTNYKIPTVEYVTVDDAVAGFKIPVGSLLVLAAILPIVMQFRKRRANSQAVQVQVAVAAILVAGSVFMYPYFNMSVGKGKGSGAKLTDQQASVVLSSLLKNVYRAFDFRDESDVYDKLAISVSGDLLGDIYLQNRKSFAVQRAGGAQAKVKDIEIIDVSIRDGEGSKGAMVLKARWTAFGTVGHWGHIHGRKNLYDALITTEVVEDAWKITALDLLEEKRIDPSESRTELSTKGYQ